MTPRGANWCILLCLAAVFGLQIGEGAVLKKNSLRSAPSNSILLDKDEEAIKAKDRITLIKEKIVTTGEKGSDSIAQKELDRYKSSLSEEDRQILDIGNAILRRVYSGLGDMTQTQEEIDAEEKEAARNPQYMDIMVAMAPLFTDCKNTRRKATEDSSGVPYPTSCFDGTHQTRHEHLQRLMQSASSQFDEVLNNKRWRIFDPDKILKAFLAPEWFFRAQKDAFTQDEMAEIVESLKRLSVTPAYDGWLISPGTIYWGIQDSSQGNKVVVFNCAPIVFGGKLLSFHCKNGQDDHLSFNEVWGESNKVSTAAARDGRQYCGKLDNKVFKVSGYQWGMDICLDHNINPVCFSKSLPPGQKLDVLMIEAAAMHFHPLKAKLSQGGLVLRCDGATGATADKDFVYIHVPRKMCTYLYLCSH